MSITEASAVATVFPINIGAGTQIGVLPLHRGHHPVWANAGYQVDICNMVDDVVVRDLTTYRLYRFPITSELLPWLNMLIGAMDEYDGITSPWAQHNLDVRAVLLNVAVRRLQGNPPARNVLEPGLVAPAVVRPHAPRTVDDMLAAIIASTPGAQVPEE